MIRILQELLPRKLRQAWREASLIRKAHRCNETFYCRALAGESDFNICINADMTVSCNCQDFDGSGHIGDLSFQNLEQIFSGTTAHRFRTMLAARKFPIPTCIHCADLKAIPVAEADAGVSRYQIPKGIMVENTAHCNLRCHMCNREKLLNLRSGKTSLSLNDVEKIALLLKDHGVKILYYFNLGEPFLPADVLKQMQIIRASNPEIRIVTSTNGQLIGADDKIKAGVLMDYIYVSLDGVDQDMVSKYQVGGNFEAAYKNMVKLVSEKNKLGGSSPIVEWKYVVFRWNDHPRHISKAIELAREAGVDVIGFYRGDVQLPDRSLRWYYHPYFKQLGKKTGDRVVINLNNIPPHLLSP